MQTRFPFCYGIAELTELPHIFVRAEVEINNRIHVGVSSDGLAPKWFTKNAYTSFEHDDLPNMCNVIRQAAAFAVEVSACDSFFDWWMQTYTAQSTWGNENEVPALLSGFGFSLLERAVLHACCSEKEADLAFTLRQSDTGIKLNALRPFREGVPSILSLVKRPSKSLTVRHTIGLGDPLTAADIAEMRPPNDGLPFTLEENIQRYGLTHFKIKLSGSFETDHARLKTICLLLTQHVGHNARFTLDGNENYSTISDFRDHWQRHRENDQLRSFFDDQLLFVEQPIHRDNALDDSVGAELESWRTAPPLIIDESDADFQSFPRAIELGYSGTSHKNCKGVLKGITNATTVADFHLRGQKLLLSAEDLVNVGPVALHQDLAVVSLLGISHIERNGHHYFAGLKHLHESQQLKLLREHNDLYEIQAASFPALAISNGQISIVSVVECPLGISSLPNFTLFEEWDLK